MLKKIVFLIVFSIGVFIGIAQTAAVTSNGDEVVLYNDGTWKFTSRLDSSTKKIDTNKTVFLKNNDATFLLKSSIATVGVNLNPKKWSFSKSGTNPEAEYSLQLKGEDAFGMLIVERTEIPMENLSNIALENARKAAPDIKIVEQQYRIVNGTKVLCLQMNGTIQGIKATFFGYYFSFEKGSIQFVTYTSQNLFKNYKSLMEELLNGFVVL